MGLVNLVEEISVGASMAGLHLYVVVGTFRSVSMPFAPRLGTGYNLPISNVPGPQTEMYWNGAHIEEIYPVSTVYDGIGLNVTVCSYADRVTFGHVAGRQMLPDIETLIPLTERALDELETAIEVTPWCIVCSPLFRSHGHRWRLSRPSGQTCVTRVGSGQKVSRRFRKKLLRIRPEPTTRSTKCCDLVLDLLFRIDVTAS